MSNNSGSSYNSGRLYAPYPPLLKTTSGRDRSRSITSQLSTSFGGSGTTNSAHSGSVGGSGGGLGGTTVTNNFTSSTTSSSSISSTNNINTNTGSTISNINNASSSIFSNTSTTISNTINKRIHPARVEYYNTNMYGAVNCLGRNSSSNGDNNQYTFRKYQTSNSLSRMNKLGPVLLELRYLFERHDNDVDIDQSGDNKNKNDDDDDDDEQKVSNDDDNDHVVKDMDDDNITTITNTTTSSAGGGGSDNKTKSIFSWYHPKTIALSRGIASSSYTTSTCLSFRLQQQQQQSQLSDGNGNNDIIHCATGLSSGALAIHTFKNVHEYVRQMEDENNNSHDNDNDGNGNDITILDSANSDNAKVTYLSHHQTRLHRAASAVAWKNSGSHTNHVAIGYSSANTDRDRAMGGQRSGVPPTPIQQRPGSDGNPGGFAFVWDVEAQSSMSKGMKQVPLHKLAHNSSVASLAWIPDGQTLVIGCQHKNLQVHDLGMSGIPPISVYAHDNSVNGIEVDPNRSELFATFSRGLAEPVKLWDVRKMDSCIAEIKTHAIQSSSSGMGKVPSFVSAIAWDTSSEGILSIATGGDLKFYNTRINSSRPVLSHISNSDGPVQCIKFAPKDSIGMKSKNNALIPQRMLAVNSDGEVADLPTQQVAPVALSNRDGRVVSALGTNLCFGSTAEGAAAMEKLSYNPSEDISATMMRRARCLHLKRYSTDAASNLQMLSLEQEQSNEQYMHLPSLENLHLVWSWIERVEQICFRNEMDSSIDERFWPAKSLCDAGVLHLLRLDVADIDEVTTFDSFSKSEVFNRNVYDSPLRRAALTACGWDGGFKSNDTKLTTDSFGYYERSAALACWHGDLGETVDALQMGAEYVKRKLAEKTESKNNKYLSSQYAETLELVAMCVAGFTSNSDKNASSSKVWKNACNSLLNRPNLMKNSNRGAHSNYLRAICSFLMDDSDLDRTLKDESLNLYDRVAFACIYLSRKQLKQYLDSCIEDCLNNGNLEGLLITGLNKKGIALLQSYVDSRSDIQTAALISSRAILPTTIEWTTERIACSEWLSSYREFLNKNQMWQSRAMFDVGRVELLRKLRDRQQSDENMVQNSQSVNRNIRRSANQIRRQMQTTSLLGKNNDNPIPPFPPQIHARCNYCNTSLPLSKLRRQESIANNWLSRQKPVLPCCPNPVCRKPLPRCSICLLPLGCLNPYMELRREGNRFSRGSHGQQRGEDLSSLANMPFAEWFAWCASCHHGGHAHHYVSWFEGHNVCPVSNCDCRCKFDVINKLKRPALTVASDKTGD